MTYNPYKTKRKCKQGLCSSPLNQELRRIFVRVMGGEQNYSSKWEFFTMGYLPPSTGPIPGCL